MQIKQFNGEAARSARIALGMSQGAVARDTLVSRPELSRFENGWLVLPDEKRRSLFEFLGVRLPHSSCAVSPASDPSSEDFNRSESLQESSSRILDGVCVAPALRDEVVDRLANELHEHQDWMDTNLAGRFRASAFFVSELETEAMRRMASAMLLLRALQGRTSNEVGSLQSYLLKKLALPQAQGTGEAD